MLNNDLEVLEEIQKEKLMPKRADWYPNFFIYNPKKDAIIIQYYHLIQYLRKLGFARLDVSENYIFIRIIDGIVEEYTTTKIVDVFEKSMVSLPDVLEDTNGYEIKRLALFEKVYKGIDSYFSKKLLSRLNVKPNLEFLEAEKDCAYFCFSNCVTKVSKNGIEVIDYQQLKNKAIWKNSILKKEFRQLDFADYKNTVFARFARNISRNKSDDRLTNIDDPQREQALKTIIGYNLHSFFDTKLKATILTDSGVSDEAEGRTGKTLITRAMGKMMNAQKEATRYIEIAGKNFDFSKSFRYEKCRLDTRLTHINDAKKDFKFELLYNDITEGVTAERKNKESYQVNTKIIVSSNRPIQLNGGSDKDRAIEFQVSDHYSMQFSPQDEFGHWLFRDWSDETWNEFYNYMLHCVHQYFLYGLIIPTNIDLEERKLREETKPEFVAYMDKCKIHHGVEFNKKEIFSDFLLHYPDFENLKQRTFTKWLRKWARSREKIERIEERESGKNYFIKFFLREENLAENQKKSAPLPKINEVL